MTSPASDVSVAAATDHRYMDAFYIIITAAAALFFVASGVLLPLLDVLERRAERRI